ncbi:MAG: hypothetical protein GX433_05515 [Deltaproteobacteria bacterium]|jgi:hypothetical protein|nr:hypothetical protein [Deltaproteobacteria bacterium]
MGNLDRSLASWIERRDAQNGEKVQFCDWNAGQDLTKAFIQDQHGSSLVERMESINLQAAGLDNLTTADRIVLDESRNAKVSKAKPEKMLSKAKPEKMLSEDEIMNTLDQAEALAKGMAGSDRGLPFHLERLLKPTVDDIMNAMDVVKSLRQLRDRPLTKDEQIAALIVQNRVLRNLADKYKGQK